MEINSYLFWILCFIVFFHLLEELDLRYNNVKLRPRPQKCLKLYKSVQKCVIVSKMLKGLQKCPKVYKT